MTDIVERLRHLALLKSLSGHAEHSRMAMNLAAAEIERLRGRIDAVRAVLEKDDGRGFHSESWCVGGCLKPKLVAVLGGYEQRAELE